MATPSPRAVVSSVRAFARRHGIFQPGPVVVAVSGGTDSVALALVLAELRDEFGLVLHVAHFDHRTRPTAAAKDAAFVAQLADRIGAPIRVGRAARATKSEDDARRARYAFLRRVATDLGACAIATGHTLDDQAETVLLHLTRGSGMAGLAGMRPLRDGIVRPLLAIGRAETTAMCRAAKIRPREDATNRSVKFARNRVRRNVLPELARINPQVRAALARFADAAAELESASQLDAASRAAAVSEQLVGSGSIELSALPSDDASRERILADLWRAASGTSLGARHRAALLALAASNRGTKRADLPGGTAVREYGRMRFAFGSARHADGAGAARDEGNAGAARHEGDAGATAPAALTRGTSLRWHGWRITLDLPSDGLPFTGAIDAALASRLGVRGRRPGDRIAGHGKLQDLFVNAKLPARLRDTWPVVTLDKEVIWVPGLTPAPHGGTVHLAAGPVETTPALGEAAFTFSSQNGQVASKSEARPRGEKRGRA